MTDATTHYWTASDRIELAYHDLGQGRPVVLLHGLFSDASMNWIRFGHAARIAEAGFRVVMPDLRAHGLSARPHGEQFYPKGILARDLRELPTGSARGRMASNSTRKAFSLGICASWSHTCS